MNFVTDLVTFFFSFNSAWSNYLFTLRSMSSNEYVAFTDLFRLTSCLRKMFISSDFWGMMVRRRRNSLFCDSAIVFCRLSGCDVWESFTGLEDVCRIDDRFDRKVFFGCEDFLEAAFSFSPSAMSLTFFLKFLKIRLLAFLPYWESCVVTVGALIFIFVLGRSVRVAICGSKLIWRDELSVMSGVFF